ncbi:RNA 2',3'-cyclic phosphodiesterase [Candidatus Falkowbacteria bacterium]|nr:RNA 2',3'-cyclic phosphodiesterase [Candidatus Falkowbacteria bacterium]
MRCFISINLPTEIRKFLGDIISRLDELNQGQNIKWVEAENIHLTLAFLGEITPQQVEVLSQGLDTIKFTPFSVSLNQLGAFPSVLQPQVIKISLRDDGHNLQKISDAIRQILSKLKIDADDKPFSAHITLGRIKNRGVAKINLQIPIEPLAFIIEHVDLMQSQLTPRGPVHSLINFFNPSHV